MFKVYLEAAFQSRWFDFLTGRKSRRALVLNQSKRSTIQSPEPVVPYTSEMLTEPATAKYQGKTPVTTKSPAFCVLPWIHTYFATDGQAGLCCVASETLVGPKGGLNIQRDELTEIFHSDALASVRRRLLSGEKIAGCSVCWTSESRNSTSWRTFYNKYWEDKIPGLMDIINKANDKAAYNKPLSVDFRFGNLCNLRCQICNTHNSTQIERDAVLSKWNNVHYLQLESRFKGNWYETEEFQEEIYDFSSEIRYINLGGGEPSISKPAHKWLAHLVERGQAKQIEITVSTNLSNINPKFHSLIAQFGRAKIYLSIDGFGILNDYLRYPSRWKTIEQNADYLQHLMTQPNLSVHLTPVVSAYNALSIVKLFDWAVRRGFDVMPFEVRGVDAIDCTLLPEEPRKIAVQRIREFIGRSGDAIPSRQTIVDLCNYLEAPVDPAIASACYVKFHQFTHELDRDRSLRFEDFEPETARALGYQSGSNSFLSA